MLPTIDTIETVKNGGLIVANLRSSAFICGKK